MRRFNMDDNYVCLIENKTYMLDEKMMNGLLDMIKENYKKKNKHAIYALKKEKIFDLKRQEFQTFYKAQIKAEEYRKQGYTVYCV